MGRVLDEERVPAADASGGSRDRGPAGADGAGDKLKDQKCDLGACGGSFDCAGDQDHDSWDGVERRSGAGYWGPGIGGYGRTWRLAELARDQFTQFGWRQFE